MENYATILELVKEWDPEERPALWLSMLTSDGQNPVDTPECRAAMSAYQQPDLRPEAFEVLLGCEAMCGPETETERRAFWAQVDALPQAEQSAAVAQVCGPDPVFGGALATTHPQMRAKDYWLYRTLFEQAYTDLQAQGPEGQAVWDAYAAEVPQLLQVLAQAYSPADLPLPEHRGFRMAPLADTLQLTPTSLRFDGLVMTPEADGRLSEESLQALRAPLAEAQAQRKARAEEGGSFEPFPGLNRHHVPLLIQAHKDTPYGLVLQVIQAIEPHASAQMAFYNPQIQAQVWQSAAPYQVPLVEEIDDEVPQQARVYMDAEGQTRWASVMGQQEPADLAEIQRTAIAEKAAYPDDDNLMIIADPTLTWGEVARIFPALETRPNTEAQAQANQLAQDSWSALGWLVGLEDPPPNWSEVHLLPFVTLHDQEVPWE